MDNVQFFHYLLMLMAGACVLTWLADRVAFPPVLALLVGGCCAALIGGHSLELDPTLVLAAILPPLLMSSAFYTTWDDFRSPRSVTNISSRCHVLPGLRRAVFTR